MKGKRVFVTGAAGVIGRELVPRLAAAGADVWAGDLKSCPTEFPDGIRYREGDLNDLSLTELNDFGPHIIIHLAATFERSVETPGFWHENFRHNVQLSHHLMTLAQDCPVLERVVFASSYLIYDQALYQFDAPREVAVRLKEGAPIQPRNLVGSAKLSHEIELAFLAGLQSCRFSTLCVRIFRGYGRNSRDVISRWVRALLKGEAITVYRPEGLFDYVYAADSAEGLMRLAVATGATGIVNLGTGRSRRVGDVVEILRSHFPDAAIRTETADIPFEASEADTTKLRELVDWVPAYDLERAIAEIVNFERQRSAIPAAVAARPPLVVLVSSAARKVPLVRAMQAAARRVDPGARVIAGDVDPHAPSRHVADAFWQMQRLEETTAEALRGECAARGIRAILPTRDGELAFWAQAKAELAKAGIAVLVSEPAAVARCLDKLAFAEWGAAKGLPVIPAASDPDGLGAERLVVKERFGAGSRGLGLDLSPQAARAHAAGLSEPIFQPFVEGREISIDAFLTTSGAVHGLVLRRRDRVVAGESQITTTFRDDRLEAQAAEILGALGLFGPVVMQAMVTGTGLAVIEVNARFGGASTASLSAGLDSLLWSLLQAVEPDRKLPPFARVPGEIRQIRVPQDIVLHDPDL
ncbi:NAD-dependent epimerase/dehydratase family protein [Jiella sp. M17.18]|uniref:NAD-dependent epimerase/dehydratase family protein n=1 Tax=Jiella sp. M17.18 TaxID=3234247 RepID=UPI0034DE0A01